MFDFSFHSNFIKSIQSYIFFLLLLFVYYFEITPKFAYVGFEFDFNIFRVIAALASIFFINIFISRNNSASSIIIHVIHYLLTLPSIFLLTFIYPSIMHALLMMMIIVIIYTTANRRLKIPKFKHVDTTNLIYFLTFISFALVSYMFAFSNFSYSLNFDIDTVHNYRRQYSEAFGLVEIYGFSNVSFAVVPLTIAIALNQKKYFIVMINCLLSILLFGLTQHKAVLFAPFAVIVFFFFLRFKFIHQKIGWIFCLILLISFIEVLLLKILNENQVAYYTSLVTRRIFLTPTYMDSSWINFFSSNDFYYWATSKISLGLVDSPYDVTAPFLIGQQVFGISALSANTGILGSGFGQAGILGVLIYSLLFRYTLIFFNTIGENVGHKLICTATILVAVNIATSSDFVTMLLTNGLLAICMLILLVPKEASRESGPQ